MERITAHARRRLRLLAVVAALVVSVLGSSLPAAASPSANAKAEQNRPEFVQDVGAHGWTWVRGGVDDGTDDEDSDDVSTRGWTWVR